MCPRVRFGFAAGLCALAIGLSSVAPVAAQTARLNAVSRMLERNRQELSRYTWTTRSEVAVAGELRQVALARARYGRDGALVETPLPGDDAAPTHKKLPKKLRSLLDRLQDLTRSYLDLDTRRMQSALARAHAWEGQGEDGNLLRIQARGVIRQADKLDLWIDSATDRPERLSVLTSLEGEPVRLTTRFERVKDGPSYAAETRVETELKEKPVVVTTTNFELEIGKAPDG